MPDTRLSPLDATRLVGQVPAERRSPGQPVGLPILATEPLTAAERDRLRLLARLMRLAGDAIDEAITRGRVADSLDAVTRIDEVSRAAHQVAATLGRTR